MIFSTFFFKWYCPRPGSTHSVIDKLKFVSGYFEQKIVGGGGAATLKVQVHTAVYIFWVIKCFGFIKKVLERCYISDRVNFDTKADMFFFLALWTMTKLKLKLYVNSVRLYRVGITLWGIDRAGKDMTELVLTWSGRA